MNPILLSGEWRKGYALDAHIISSVYLGEDEYGRPKFKTIRSDLGELVYELKYKNNLNVLDDIEEIIQSFFEGNNFQDAIDCIIPVPSSNKRVHQPVDNICSLIGNILKKEVVYNCLKKNSNNQSKNLDSSQKVAIKGSIQRLKYFEVKVNVLLVDDLYDSGVTLNECVRVLKEDKNINNIYVLTMTKTKG